MALNQLDSDIRDCIQSINSGSDSNPSYCGWVLSMRTREDAVFQYIRDGYPALIQFIEDKELDLPNGNIEKTIDFYFINPKGNTDVETVRELHDTLNLLVLKFQLALTDYYKCEFVGDRLRLIDQIASVYEAGISFSLKITIDKPCLT